MKRSLEATVDVLAKNDASNGIWCCSSIDAQLRNALFSQRFRVPVSGYLCTTNYAIVLSPVTFHSAILDHITYMYIFIFGFADPKSWTCSWSSYNVDLDLFTYNFICSLGLISRFYSLSLSLVILPHVSSRGHIFHLAPSFFRSTIFLSLPSTSHNGVNKLISKVQVISKSYRPLQIKCVDESRAKSRQIIVSHRMIR